MDNVPNTRGWFHMEKNFLRKRAKFLDIECLCATKVTV